MYFKVAKHADVATAIGVDKYFLYSIVNITNHVKVNVNFRVLRPIIQWIS